MFGNIFGGDDNEDDERSSDDDDWEVDVSINTGFTKSSGSGDGGSASGWFRTHTIDLSSDVDQPAESGADSPAGPTTPSTPDVAPGGSSKSHDRGTFVFPAHRDFLQKLEARGLNGAHQRVETVYVLAGSTYTTPTDLFRLDNPEYYASATRRSVTSYGRKMARKVASLYPDGQAPKLLVRFHTHPNGSTRPSDTDRSSAGEIASQFADAFGTSDFEFFQGIHAYKDHSGNPGPSERHEPVARSNSASWRGEQYRHELALYGPEFRNPRRVVIGDD